MLSIFVLRIRTDGLSVGALAGEVEHVETGRRERFRSLDELATFITKAVETHTKGAPCSSQAAAESGSHA